MFYTEIANVLQFFSLPMELLGIILALIEIRYRRVAAYLRSRILDAYSEVSGGFYFSWRRSQREAWARNPLWLNVVSTLFIVAVVLFSLWTLRDADLRDWLFIGAFFLASLAAPFVLGPGFRLLLRGVLRFVSTFAEGREIGTLGLIIALMGLSAEVYQFAEAAQQVAGIPAPELPQSESLVWRTMIPFVLALVVLLVFLSYIALAFGLVGYWQHRRTEDKSTGE